MTSPPAPEHLHFEKVLPSHPQDGCPLILLLHGRGSNEKDLLALASYLSDDAIVVTPRAPFPARPWGYGPGWAWYRYLAEDRVVDETLRESVEALDRFVDHLDTTLPVRPGPCVMGGFSQGGTTSLAWGLSRPGRLAGAINLSGFLVDSPEVSLDNLTHPTLPVFWGHGSQDPAIPFELGEKGRKKLRELDVPLDVFDHPGGHTITGDEIAALQDWLDGILQAG